MSKFNIFDMEHSNNNSFGDVNLEVENSDDSMDVSIYTMKSSSGNKFGNLNFKAGSSAEKIRQMGIAISNIHAVTEAGQRCQDSIIDDLSNILDEDAVISKKDWGKILSTLSIWITIKGEASSQLQAIYDTFSPLLS